MELLQHETGQEIEIHHFQDQDHARVNGATVTNTVVHVVQVLLDTVAEMTVTKKIAILHAEDTHVHHHILETGKVAGMMETEDQDHVLQCHHEEGIMVIGRILHLANV